MHGIRGGVAEKNNGQARRLGLFEKHLGVFEKILGRRLKRLGPFEKVLGFRPKRLGCAT